VRVTLTGYLGKAEIPLQIDVGFSDVVTPGPLVLEYPALLGMPAPQLRGYPPESVVAEKLQALVFLGSVNSRMKDYYDLWVLAEQFEFDGRSLQKAITNTFQRRHTALPSEIPVGLSDSFAVENETMWQAFIQRVLIELAPESFTEVTRVLNSLLVPPLQTSALGNIFEGVWKTGGPWKSLAE